MSETESPHQLSRHTTPTWEVELLISGVAVFAMLQLPGRLDDGMFWLAPRLDEAWAMVAMLLYVYAKSAAVILALTFVIHLLLRARWIALVGMHSVYPDGVRWDKLRMGPIQREIERDYEVSTDVIIERADNLATTVFAVGVMLALVLVAVTVVVAIVMGTATALASAMEWKDGGLWLFFVAFGLVMAPFLLALTLDRRYGAHWNRGTWPARSLESVLRLFARIGMRPGKNRIRALLASNGSRDSERRVGVLIMLIIGVTTTMVIVGYKGMRDGAQFGSYGMFPDADGLRIHPAHYDDQRNPARDDALPFVQSAVITGPYLKLVVPYRPNRDEPAMRQQCVQAAGLQGNALAMARRTCLQTLHAVTLDGKPLADLHYEIASDSRTNRPALVAMIDIRALGPGRHELRVRRAVPDPDDNDVYVIPFWR